MRTAVIDGSRSAAPAMFTRARMKGIGQSN